MLSTDEKARPYIKTSAKNEGHGSQYISDQSGDQLVATDSGRVVKIDRQFNISVNPKGIPCLFNLTQSHSIHRPENYLLGPDCVDIIDWLKRQPDQTPLNFHQHHKELLYQVAQGTGEWILKTKEFLTWKDASSSSRFLWMHGILGSGKTMLISLIINSLQRDFENGADAACVYFYFQEGENHESFARIWATLLVQLLRASKDPEGELKTKFDDSLQGWTTISTLEYLDLFKAQAAAIKTVYLIIDGLDSCQNTPEEETRQKMQDAFEALPDNVRVLVASRNDSQDVETYVKKRIIDSTRLRTALKNSQDRDYVVSKVTDMTLSSKMFLSARLHMNDLCKQGTLSDIKTALGRLPDSAFKIFDESALRIARKICSRDDDFESCLAKHTLTWVIHAKVELTDEQIRDSFAIQKSNGRHYKEHRPDKELLMPACNGLVIMDPEDKTLSLVHKSAQGSLQKHGIIPKNANFEIAKTCLYCLLADTCEQEGESMLLQYAAKYWWAHLNRQGKEVDSEAESLALEFLRDSSKLARAFRAIEGTDNHAFDHMTGLHAVVYFDLLSWAKRLLEVGIDVNAQCSDGQTALHWAVRYGRCELAQLFIDYSAEPNIRDHAGDTPLHKALTGQTDDKSPFHQAIMTSTANNVRIVEVLAKGKAQLHIENFRGFSPMLLAIRYGPTSIAKVMVENQEDVDAEIFNGWTSLRQVFFHGHDIVETGTANHRGRHADDEGWAQLQHAVGNHARLLTDVLLKRGVNLNRPSTVDGWMPLVHAAKTGDKSKLDRLLRRQPNPADARLPDSNGNSPLWWAVEYKKIDAIQLLVDHGSEVNETYTDESTPLLMAIKQKNSEMAQLLIRLGADVNKRTRNGSTALIEAVKLHDHDTAWVLLNAKAELGGRDASGRSALFYAVETQDKALAWLLIAKSESAVSSTKGLSSEDMQDALKLAMTYNSISMAWLLCEHGASPGATNGQGATLLHRAAKDGNYKAAQFLVERGVFIDAKDATGSTPLHYAVLSGQNHLTDLLASRRLGLNAPDSKGNTALILATLKTHYPAMQALLRYGASCNIAGAGGLTALHHAAALGFNKGLSLILDRYFNGDPNVVDEKHFTPLHRAVNGGRAGPKTVKMLVEAGANMELQDMDERTPLMLAAQLGYEKLVRSLLALGAESQTSNNSGWTAIDFAEDFPNIRRLL